MATLKELKAQAKAAGLTDYSSLNKAQLLAALAASLEGNKAQRLAALAASLEGYGPELVTAQEAEAEAFVNEDDLPPVSAPDGEGATVRGSAPWAHDPNYLVQRFPNPAHRTIIVVHRVAWDDSQRNALSFHGLPYPLTFDANNDAEIPKGDWDRWVKNSAVFHGLEVR